MSTTPTHWLAPGLIGELRDPAKGYGVFTERALKAGELVAVWGGNIIDRDGLAALTPRQQMHAVQIEEGLYMASLQGPEAADYFNHSCEPNCGVQGQVAVVAMRDIAAGEELCFDYAMTDSSDYDEFPCACGASSCRKTVRGDDWKLPKLQVKYAGFFSRYLERRIEALG